MKQLLGPQDGVVVPQSIFWEIPFEAQPTLPLLQVLANLDATLHPATSSKHALEAIKT